MKVLYIYFKFPFFINGSYFQEFIDEISQKIEKIYVIAINYPKNNINLKKKKNVIFFGNPS